MKITLILIALTCIGLIIFLIRDYYDKTERLTGKWYRRRRIGFVNYDVIVEYKLNGKTFTKIATEREIRVLRKKFNITNFKALESQI